MPLWSEKLVRVYSTWIQGLRIHCTIREKCQDQSMLPTKGGYTKNSSWGLFKSCIEGSWRTESRGGYF